MSITIGTGIFLIVALLVYIFNKKDYKKMFMSFFMVMIMTKFFINIGYFVKIGSFDIMYDEFFTFLTFISALKYLTKNNSSLTYKKNIFCLIISISFSIILNFLLSYNEYGIRYGGSWDDYFLGTESFKILTPSFNSLLQIVRIFMFFTIYYTFSKEISKSKFKKMMNVMFCISIFAVIMFIIEFVQKNMLHSYFLNDFYNKIFGLNDATYTGLGSFHNGYYSVTFLYREQSHLSEYFFFISLMMLLSSFIFKKKKYFLVSLLMIGASILSISFTSLLCAGIYYLVFSYLVIKHSKKYSKFAIMLLIVIICITPFLINKSIFSERINNSLYMILNFNSQGVYAFNSENVRLFSVMYNYDLFRSHFLFGLGIGTSYSHSGLSTTLVSIGSVGLVLYFITYKNLITKNLRRKYPYVLTFIIMGFFLFTGVSNLMYNDGLALFIMGYSLFLRNDIVVKEGFRKNEHITTCSTIS